MRMTKQVSYHAPNSSTCTHPPWVLSRRWNDRSRIRSSSSIAYRPFPKNTMRRWSNPESPHRHNPRQRPRAAPRLPPVALLLQPPLHFLPVEGKIPHTDRSWRNHNLPLYRSIDRARRLYRRHSRGHPHHRVHGSLLAMTYRTRERRHEVVVHRNLFKWP
jgi:hypothetical protein